MGRGQSTRRGYPMIGGNRGAARATGTAVAASPQAPRQSVEEILTGIVRSAADAHYPSASGESTGSERTKGAAAAATILRATEMLDDMTRGLGSGIRECFAAGDVKGALEIQAKAMALSTEIEAQSEPTPDQIHAATRIAQAEAHLGAPVNPLDWVVFSHELMSHKGLARRVMRHRAGDRAERDAALIESYTQTPQASTPQQILAQARAALRNPNAYQAPAERGSGAIFGGPQERKAPQFINVFAEHAALRALLEGEWADVPMALSVESGPGMVGRQVVASLMLDNPNDGEGPTLLEVWSQIPEGTAKSLTTYLPAGPITTRKTNRIRTGSLTTQHAAPKESDRTASPAPLNVLGRDDCDHPAGQWHAEAIAGHPTDCMRLACPDCLRNRIAVLPLHRIDAGAELIGDPEAYLSVMRYQAALVGDKRPCESVDQLRLRDGLASVDPADYASQQPLGPRTIRSVLDAMNRR